MDLREQYDFDRWRGRGERRLIRNLRPDLSAEDFELESYDRISGEESGFIDFYRMPSRPVRVAVTMIEHPNAEDAQDSLLRILALVMGPPLPPCANQGLDAGDVCFCSPGERLEKVFFVRANMLVRVENAGRERIDLRKVARLIDEQLQTAAEPVSS